MLPESVLCCLFVVFKRNNIVRLQFTGEAACENDVVGALGAGRGSERLVSNNFCAAGLAMIDSEIFRIRPGIGFVRMRDMNVIRLRIRRKFRELFCRKDGVAEGTFQFLQRTVELQVASAVRTFILNDVCHGYFLFQSI